MCVSISSLLLDFAFGAMASVEESKSATPKARIELGDLTQHNLKQLKVLNSAVFPVVYNEKFYLDVLEHSDFAKLAYCNDVVVGAVCCRLDKVDDKKQLYIMTLGCLAPYRRLGVGSVLLDFVFQLCKGRRDVESICLHVQVNNDEALGFYGKFGFQSTERKEKYYKRIEPPDAFLLKRSTEDLHAKNSS